MLRLHRACSRRWLQPFGGAHGKWPPRYPCCARSAAPRGGCFSSWGGPAMKKAPGAWARRGFCTADAAASGGGDRTGAFVRGNGRQRDDGGDRRALAQFGRDGQAAACGLHAVAHAGQPVGVDRKSTRLNSSHLVISYAVFCLKKKKQPIG